MGRSIGKNGNAVIGKHNIMLMKSFYTNENGDRIGSGLRIGGNDNSCYSTGSPYEDNYINSGNDLGGNQGETFPSDYVPTIEIINHINDPCLKKMVQYSIDNNIKINIKQSINSIFQKNDDFTLNYFEDSSLPNSIDGTASPINDNRFPGGNGLLTIDIKLNANTLPNASKEYVTATILHEALHAYFIFNNSIGSLDHEDMARNYLNWFVTSLTAIYPNLSLDDAKMLGWGGLHETQSYRLFTSPNEKISIYQINNDYKSKRKGTPCI